MSTLHYSLKFLATVTLHYNTADSLNNTSELKAGREPVKKFPTFTYLSII